MERYVQALDEGDGEAACELLTRGAVAELEDRSGGRDCHEALGDLLGEGDGLDEAGDLEVTDVNVAGDTATATIEGPEVATVTELTKQGDEWKVASPGGR